VHLVGRNKLDTVWLGVDWRPAANDLQLLSLLLPLRVLPHISSNIGQRVTRMDGVTVTMTDRCAGCGTCAKPGVCFVDDIRLVDGRS